MRRRVARRARVEADRVELAEQPGPLDALEQRRRPARRPRRARPSPARTHAHRARGGSAPAGRTSADAERVGERVERVDGRVALAALERGDRAPRDAGAARELEHRDAAAGPQFSRAATTASSGSGHVRMIMNKRCTMKCALGQPSVFVHRLLAGAAAPCRAMSMNRTSITTGITLAALGVLAAVAIGAGGGEAKPTQPRPIRDPGGSHRHSCPDRPRAARRVLPPAVRRAARPRARPPQRGRPPAQRPRRGTVPTTPGITVEAATTSATTTTAAATAAVATTTTRAAPAVATAAAATTTRATRAVATAAAATTTRATRAVATAAAATTTRATRAVATAAAAMTTMTDEVAADSGRGNRRRARRVVPGAADARRRRSGDRRRQADGGRAGSARGDRAPGDHPPRRRGGCPRRSITSAGNSAPASRGSGSRRCGRSPAAAPAPAPAAPAPVVSRGS